MMKNFVEMVNVKIEEEVLLTICIKCGNVNIMNSIVPYSINVENGIHIKGDWMNLDVPSDYEISYNEFDDEFTVECENMTIFFS